jgi:hypothetical protein
MLRLLSLSDHDRLRGFAAEAIVRYFARIGNATD